MVVYTVHEPSRPATSLIKHAEQIVFVKEGFSWWGLLLSPFWLIANKLWFEAIGLIFLSILVGMGLNGLGLTGQAAAITSLFLSFIVGFEGHNLKRWQLERKGYVLITSVMGVNADECEKRFFEVWLPYASSHSNGTPGRPSSKDLKISNADLANWRGSTVIGTLSEA